MAVRRARPEDDQESYFVSMTDLMIGLLFIFIIMLMSFAINYREAEQRHQQTNERLTDNQDTVEYILGELEQSLENQGIEVSIDPDKGVLRLPESILFESGQAKLTKEGKQAVGALAIALEPFVTRFASVVGSGEGDSEESASDADYHGRLEAVLIEGHTDSEPVWGGEFRSNWDLSTARAIATFTALEQAAAIIGQAVNDRSEKLVGVSGYGEHRPVASNDHAAGRRANRRIDLRFLMAAPSAAKADG
ncbi:MAG: OmpA family protein [Alphaproteobacteria bacterium]